MAHVISEACTACDACRPVCPVNAISEGDPIYKIDPNLCNDCADQDSGPLCVTECPVDAISQG